MMEKFKSFPLSPVLLWAASYRGILWPDGAGECSFSGRFDFGRVNVFTEFSLRENA